MIVGSFVYQLALRWHRKSSGSKTVDMRVDTLADTLADTPVDTQAYR
jgi:hypothetical protein